MIFAQPIWFLLLLLLPLISWLRKKRRHNQAISIRLPRAALMRGGNTWRSATQRLLPFLRFLAVGLLIVAMARPQKKWQEQKIKADAVDIMLAMDISPSMLSRDFYPDRLTVAKQVATDFISKRPYDRLGLVGFSAEAFTQCPLTTDHPVLQEFVDNLQTGRLEDGTSIGMGLATAVNRLKDSPARSKVVILLTDGENTVKDSYIAPMQAAEIANTLNVRVYTVGIGSEGVVMSPSRRKTDGSYEFSPRRLTFNTDLLEHIARLTNGKFYRAQSAEDLASIYTEIDKLEKTNITVTTKRHLTEMAYVFISAAMVLLVLEILLRWLMLRTLTPA